MKVFKELMWFFKREKKRYISGVTILVFVAALSLLPPYVVGIIVDGIQTEALSQSELMQWMVLLLIAAGLMYGLRYIWQILIFGASLRLGKLLRNQLYQHFTTMSPQFYNQRRIGDLMAHSTNDIEAIEDTAGDGVLTLVDSLTIGVFVIMVMTLGISWPLTLIVLLPMPLMAWATGHYGNLLFDRFHKAQASFSELNDKVQQNVSGVRVIKAFGQEEAEKQSFKKQTDDVVDKNIAVARIDALFEPTISMIVGVSYFLAIAFGSWFIVRGEMTIGQLTTFLMYLGQLIWPMLAFGFFVNIVQRGSASYQRVDRLLQITPDIVDKKPAIQEIPSGDVQVHIEQFSYPDSDSTVLENIQFTLEKGQTLGIVGKTGAGKTTLLRLMLREFDCLHADIHIGEHSIYDYSLSSLRSSVGYVPQDHFLFSTTLAENIAYGKPEATMDEIRQVARMASIHEDIIRFEDGYGTIVGERGVTLSGGQKQRISIARALLLDPEVLIFDDSLSAVDAKTEEDILQALKAFRRNKTTIIAAHRLSSIQHADLILVLDEGRILEKGNHEQLMSQHGWYASMYRHQQLESLVAEGGAPQ